jgi:hypothetical protein
MKTTNQNIAAATPLTEQDFVKYFRAVSIELDNAFYALHALTELADNLIQRRLPEKAEPPRLAAVAVPETPVRVGQVWADGDPASDRRITVEAIQRYYALCRSSRTNRISQIRLNRFKPDTRGYRLVQDAPAQ